MKLTQHNISIMANESFRDVRKRFALVAKLQGKSASQLIVDFMTKTANKYDFKEIDK